MRIHSPWLGTLGAASALLCGLAVAAEVRQPLAQSHVFAIAAQPLAEALLAFGQLTGVQVSVASSLLQGRTSPGSHGLHTAAQALTELLGHSGVGWRLNPSGDTVLLEANAAALEITENIVVLGQRDDGFQGSTLIERRAIEAFPGANGDITTLLQMHPSVQFAGAEKNATTGGEIDPANISINGAKFYQNSFMIDGVSINNDLDPAAQSMGQYRGIENLPSRSHGIALDADLLETVHVYDHNVPAEYGGFNGGVVDAITRRPSEDLHGKVSASMTRSSWTAFHIADDKRAAFENSTDEDNQPHFEKLTVRATLEGHVTENFGLIANVSRKSATIPLPAQTDGYQSTSDHATKDQTRQIDNFMVKAYWTASERLDTSLSITHAPQTSVLYRVNTLDSRSTISQGGEQVAFTATWLGDAATYKHTLAYTRVQSSRTSAQNDYKTWRWSQEKNWGSPLRDGVPSATAVSNEGGNGQLEQTQVGTAYTVKADWLPLTAFGITHNLQTGLELEQKVARYSRDQPMSVASGLRTNANTAGNLTCANGAGVVDSAFCSISDNALGVSTRQYQTSLNVYQAGSIALTQNRYALFFQDQVQLGQLSLRPGLRWEGDDYMDKQTVAPRFAAQYDLFDDRTTLLNGGLNRYYGRNLFAYRLNSLRESLRSRRTRPASNGTTLNDFGALENYGVDETAFRKLDIPYDDELALGITQRWYDTTFDLSYVKRKGREQIMRSRASTLGLPAGDGSQLISNYYTYTNVGKSESDNVSLTVTPDWKLKSLHTSTSLQIALSWSATRTNMQGYERLVSASELADDDVVYDGKVMHWSDLPADDFNRPFTARLTTQTDIPLLHLAWSNFLRYRGGYQQIVNRGGSVTVNGVDYDLYEAARVKAAPTWDTRVQWEIATGLEQSVFIAVDVTNVANRAVPIVSSGGGETFESGRQFWLEVGYRF